VEECLCQLQEMLLCVDYYEVKKERSKMPQVGKKKFAYTKAGKKKAKSYAKKKGKKVRYG